MLPEGRTVNYDELFTCLKAQSKGKDPDIPLEKAKG